MPDFIDRYAAKSLLPPEISREIIQGAIKYSVGMQIFKRGRNMTTGELIMPALSMLPVGGWLKATPHKERLTPLWRICGYIFRHTTQKSFEIRKYSFEFFVQSSKKFISHLHHNPCAVLP